MSLPELEPEQRRAALEKAAEARRVRAELKQSLKAGEVTFAEALERSERSEPLAKMRVSDVLRAMPGYGQVRSAELMDEVGISSNRRLRGLGTNQRARLLAEFGEDASR